MKSKKSTTANLTKLPPSTEPQKSKKKKIIKNIIWIVAIIVLVLIPVMAIYIYNSNFNTRYETESWKAYKVSDFEGLQVEECTFKSNNEQVLTGYQYSKVAQSEKADQTESSDQEIKGVVVISHGLGCGGQNTYMNVADYFTSNGYLVFAYDATGNGKSEGDAVGGLPQGIIDLDYALQYVEQSETYKNLPITLFGHSWGAYAAGSVLALHPDVKAAILVAGVNSSTDLLEQQGSTMMGSAIGIMMPYFFMIERVKFGEYASYNALSGFAKSDAGIMVIQSKDDTTILPEYGYDKFYASYGDDPRFTFIEFEDRGHDYVYTSDAARAARDQLNLDYADYVEANGGEYNAEIKAEFMEKYLDKAKCFELDETLMKQMVEFYDSYCK